MQGGGLPVPTGGVVELKLTFKDGGAFDFHSNYERIRERLQQAVAVSRIDGDGSGSSRTAMNGVDVSNVNLDELPAYQERSDGPLVAPIASAVPIQQAPQPQRDSGIGAGSGQPKPTPAEPPPNYEDVQMESLHDEAEWRDSQERR